MVPLLACALVTLTGAAFAAGANLLANGSFEVAGGAVAEGWAFETASGDATAARVEGDAPEGSAFARVVRKSEGQADLRPTAGFTPVAHGTAYLLTARVRASNVAEASHSLELQWFAGDTYVGRATGQARVSDKWVRVCVGPVAAPPKATRMIPLLRCYAAGTYDFDDVRLAEVTGMPESLLTNPGFEGDADGDGVPDGWTFSPQGAAADTEVVASGTCSARLARTSADAAPAYVRQRLTTVEPGRRYELSAATRCDSFGRELRIAIEWMQGDRLLATDELRDQTLEAWQRKRVASTCPPEATRADVVLELVSAGTVWFDDVALSALETVAEVTLDIRKPNPRGLIRQGVDAASVTLQAKWTASIPGARCVLTVTGAGENREMPVGADAEPMALDMAGLPLGQYALRAEVRGPDGAVLAFDDATVDIVPPDAHGVFFGGDHVAVVDGAPWFPIGLTSVSPIDEEAPGLARAGFNLLVTGTISQGTAEEMRAVLDRASALGIRVIEWNNGWVYGGLTAEARETAARKMAENAGDHPAFLGSACDEAIWNGIPLRDVEGAYLLSRRLLPTRLFWQNQAPRNTIEDLARYCRAADVTGMDIYPVDMPEHSDLPNKTLSVVGDEVEKNIATVEGRKPVWAILQGFGWFVWSGDPATHKRTPNWAETRFMAYDAILRGAVGVIYWGASYEKRDTEIWTHLRRIAGELRDLTPALVAPDRFEVPVSAPDGGVIAIGRSVDGKAYIIAANESGAPRQATITLPEGRTRFVRWGEDGAAPAIEGSTLRDAFEAYGVHVYREE